MKSYVEFLKGLYLAILADCEADYPELATDWTRDRTRLLSALKHRGIHFLLLDLPAYGKHFVKCLSSGSLSPSNIAYMGGLRKRRSIPELFQGLTLRVFDETGLLRPDPDVHAIYLLYTLFTTAKSVRNDCSDSAIKESVAEYFEVESQMRSPSLRWDCDEFEPVPFATSFADFHRQRDSDWSSTDEFGQHTLPFDLSGSNGSVQPRPDDSRSLSYLQLVADFVIGNAFKDPLGDLSPRHGPGAVAERIVSANKYAFPFWSAKLDAIFPHILYGLPSEDPSWYEEEGFRDSFRNHEPPSRLLAVPKTMKGPRLIASEPTSHMWMQQALLKKLRSSISASILRHVIHLDDQTVNGAMALSASSTGSHATLDLSSASDRISCAVIERLFRSRTDWLMAFHAVRTRWGRNEVHSGFDKFYRLKKFSTQGSALTFPVQSVLFSLVCIAAVMRQRELPISLGNAELVAREVRVFGDDLIVPVDSAQAVIQLLTELGLKVNLSK